MSFPNRSRVPRICFGAHSTEAPTGNTRPIRKAHVYRVILCETLYKFIDKIQYNKIFGERW